MVFKTCIEWVHICKCSWPIITLYFIFYHYFQNLCFHLESSILTKVTRTNTAWEYQPCGNLDGSRTSLCVWNDLSEILDVSVKFTDSKVIWDYNFSLFPVHECSLTPMPILSKNTFPILSNSSIPQKKLVFPSQYHPRGLIFPWASDPEGKDFLIKRLFNKACKNKGEVQKF